MTETSQRRTLMGEYDQNIDQTREFINQSWEFIDKSWEFINSIQTKLILWSIRWDLYYWIIIIFGWFFWGRLHCPRLALSHVLMHFVAYSIKLYCKGPVANMEVYQTFAWMGVQKFAKTYQKLTIRKLCSEFNYVRLPG